MDRNTIGNEIEAEINASYRYKNLREILYLFFDCPYKHYTFKHFEI